MKESQKYRNQLTNRIWSILDEISTINTLCEKKLEELEQVNPIHQNKIFKDLQCYINKAEYLSFEAYMLSEVRDLIAK
jgi:hypothetical protein